MAGKKYFDRATMTFLQELALNNRREWFKANKDRYDRDVKAPALQFIEDFGPHLKKVSRQFKADPRPGGGSLFRIHRDVRFSKDKSPYKTAVGIRFPHVMGKDVHAPGFYLHIEPGGSFMGCGVWHPETKVLTKIREAIVSDPARWKRLKGAKRFRERLEMGGESLARAPKGFDPDHPLVEDLKRKDFTVYSPLAQKVVTSATLIEEYTDLCRRAGPLQRFLCEALGVPY